MIPWSDEAVYALDVLRFLALGSQLQRELLFGGSSPEWIGERDPLRGVLEEFSENSRFLMDPDASPQRISGDQVVRELDALIEILLWADDHHPSGRVYTAKADALERQEWSLLRRLSGVALDAYREPRAPFSGEWEMIFAR